MLINYFLFIQFSSDLGILKNLNKKILTIGETVIF